MMEVVLAGFPTTNAILVGLDAISRGEDLDDVLLSRQQLLSHPMDFLHTAWEALAWIVVDVLTEDLLAQMDRALDDLSVDEKTSFMQKARTMHPSLNQQKALEHWGVS